MLLLLLLLLPATHAQYERPPDYGEPRSYPPADDGYARRQRLPSHLEIVTRSRQRAQGAYGQPPPQPAYPPEPPIYPEEPFDVYPVEEPYGAGDYPQPDQSTPPDYEPAPYDAPPNTFSRREPAYLADNQVDGLPLVTCGSEEIGIVVNTERPFLGRIFVAGQSKRRDCVREFLNNTAPEGGLQLPLAACGMRRERKLSPRPGLEESVTVVVSFHYVFITANDRAYKVVCAYGQDSQSANTISVVTHGLNISNIPTIQLTPAPNTRSAQPAECNYEIRRGGFQGPYALYAEVGDILFHKWTCDGPADLNILVKSCLVSDGSGEMFVVVDDRGCAVDPKVLPDLTYSGSSAWVEAKAFKFADTSFIGFSCTIQVCSDPRTCQDISPPSCAVAGDANDISVRTRGQYQHQRLSDSPLPPLLKDEIDVSAPSLNILDSHLFSLEAAAVSAEDRGSVIERTVEAGPESGAVVCVSRFSVGLSALLLAGLFLSLVTTLFCLFLKTPARQRKT